MTKLTQSNHRGETAQIDAFAQSDDEVKTGAASIAHEQLQPTQVTEQPVALQSQLEATPLVIEEPVALQPLSLQEAVAHLQPLKLDEAPQLQTQPCAQGAGMQDAEDLAAEHYYQQTYIPSLQLEPIPTVPWVGVFRWSEFSWSDAHDQEWGPCDAVDTSWVRVPHVPSAMQPEVEQSSHQRSWCDPLRICAQQDLMSMPTEPPDPAVGKKGRRSKPPKNPPQEKIAEPQDPMTVAVRFSEIPDLQSAALLLKVQCTAEAAEFPKEALKQDPKGYYAWKWEEKTYQFGRTRPDVPVAARDFVSRMCNDAVILRFVIKQCLSFQQPVAPGYEIFGPPWSDALKECFQTKPDLRFFGFVPIPDGLFETKFRGDNCKFLQHMCEKHHGESIAVGRTIKEDVENPRNANMHHPQFFVKAHKYLDAHKNMSRAARYFNPECSRGRGWRPAGGTHAACGAFDGGANEGQFAREAFVTEQSAIENSVYFPGSSASKCKKVEVAYHTLPSLIYNCCEVASLIDIYTYFCTQELLTSKAPHSVSKGINPPQTHKPQTR